MKISLSNLTDESEAVGKIPNSEVIVRVRKQDNVATTLMKTTTCETKQLLFDW